MRTPQRGPRLPKQLPRNAVASNLASERNVRDVVRDATLTERDDGERAVRPLLAESVVVAICTACGAELPAVDATIRCGCGATLARDGGELRVVISASDGAISIGAAIGGPWERR